MLISLELELPNEIGREICFSLVTSHKSLFSHAHTRPCNAYTRRGMKRAERHATSIGV